MAGIAIKVAFDTQAVAALFDRQQQRLPVPAQHHSGDRNAGPTIDRAAALQRVRDRLAAGDRLLLGLDLRKDPHTVLAAYDDSAGVTAAFNLNLLRRLNRELQMDFDLAQFRHYATYSPHDGVARSYLVSERAQVVGSRVLRRSFRFEAGESIYTEQSQKYDRDMVQALTQPSGFAVQAWFEDPQLPYALVACQALA